MVVLLVVVAFIAGVFAAFLALYAFNSSANLIVSRWIEKRVYIEESAMISAVSDVMPAVVSIEVLGRSSFGGKGGVVGGTGFVFDKSGLVLTNKHIVKRTDESADYKITFGNGDEYQAVLMSRDPFNDIAVLKIISDVNVDFQVVKLGDSKNLEVGQNVLAVGNALLTYDHSVTSGIISGLGRDVSAYYYDFKGPGENIAGLIQTDAAVNAGNSGGPLINLQGEVVGMVTALEDSACGIGFAIPVDDLKSDIVSIEKYGEIVRPALGVRFVMLNDKDAKVLNTELSHGAFVVGDKSDMKDAVAKNSNVYKAGLREGDVVLYVDDIKIDLEHYLNDVIRNYEPGDVVKLKFWRDGEEKSMDVVLNNSKDFE